MTSRKTFAPDGAGSSMSRAERRYRLRKGKKRSSSAFVRNSPTAHLNAQQRAQASGAVEEAGRLIQAGQFRDALERLEGILKLAPGHPEALAQKANLAYVHGQYDEAIALFQESITNEDRAANVHFNLGAVLIKVHRYDEALAPLKRSIKLMPSLAAAHNALGAALVGLWRYDQAIPVLKKSLALSGPQAPVLTNLGLAYFGLGKVEPAITYITKALRFKVDPEQIYLSITPLAILLAFSEDPKDQAAWDNAKENLSKAMPGSPVVEFLEFVLENRKVDPAPDALTRVQSALPPLTDETVSFSTPQIIAASRNATVLPTRVCALLHFGRSATGLLHTLVDGHPQVTTLPGVYFKGFFGLGVWDQIRSRDPDAMIGRFMNLYEVLFDARHPKPVPGNPSSDAVALGAQEGFCHMGPNRDQVLTLDKKAFRAHMLELLAGRESVSQEEFFLMLHRAFERAQGKSGDEELVFYHIHSPVAHEFTNFLRYSPDAQIVMMAREPLQNCESWISTDIFETLEYRAMAVKIAQMPFEISRPEFAGRDSFGLRLDDLKRKPEATMRALAARLGIAWDPCLLQPTMQGLEHWGDPSGKSFGCDPFDTAVLDRKVGKVFGDHDQRLLRALYYPFRVGFGWEEPDDKAFQSELAEVPALLAQPFDCEKLLLETNDLPQGLLDRHVSYKYLRLVLASRLATLQKHGTYPGLLQPLMVEG